MENFVSGSPSLENKHVDSQNQQSFFSSLIPSNFDSYWSNPIYVDAVACSIGTLRLDGHGSTSTAPVTNNFRAFTDPIPIPVPAIGAADQLSAVPNCSTHQHQHQHQFPQHRKFSSLQDVKARLVSLADAEPHQHLGRPELVEMILWLVKDHLCDLMMDQHCNYLIQTVFQATNEDHITRILAMITRNDHKLKQVCMHNHGTRGIQKLLEYLKTPKQISTAIYAVKRITVRLSKSISGGYIIQQCFNLFSPALTTLITDEVANNCVEIATDKNGSCIFQKCLHHAKGDALRRLIEEIISQALVLAEHPYGNYVVQYVVKMKISHINTAIISNLLGKYAQLSMNKHASNVVEALLELSEEQDVAIIIQEIIHNHNFLGILQDLYGTFVVQRALLNCKGILNKILTTSILCNYPHLHNHVYGKRILAFVKRRKNCVQMGISK